MRTLTTILSLSLLLTGLTVAQSADPTIKDIDIKCKVIQDKLDTYDTTRTTIGGQSTEDGELTGYYDKDNLKLMTVVYYGETGKRQTDYYFDNGQLCFVQDIFYRYNRPIYWDGTKAKENRDTVAFDSDKTEINEHDRYYFDSKELIHWIDWSGRPGDKRLATFKNRENSIPKEVDELKEKLKESTGANTR